LILKFGKHSGIKNLIRCSINFLFIL